MLLPATETRQTIFIRFFSDLFTHASTFNSKIPCHSAYNKTKEMWWEWLNLITLHQLLIPKPQNASRCVVLCVCVCVCVCVRHPLHFFCEASHWPTWSVPGLFLVLPPSYFYGSFLPALNNKIHGLSPASDGPSSPYGRPSLSCCTLHPHATGGALFNWVWSLAGYLLPRNTNNIHWTFHSNMWMS